MSGGGGGTQVTRSSIPEEYKEFAKQNLAIAGTMANTPYIGYQGPTIAGFNQDMATGFDAVRQSPGTWTPTLDASTGVYTGLSETGGQKGFQNIGNYMNPFTNTVVGNTVADMVRANQIGQNQLNATASGAGAFGGSRHGIANAEMQRNLLDRVGSTAGQLRSRGFDTAAQLGMSDAARDTQTRLASAQGLSSNAQQAQQQALAHAQAMMQIAGLQQSQQQANLDRAQADFYDQLNHPVRQLALRQSALGQTPMGSIQRTPKPGPNIGGLLSGAGSLFSGLAGLGLCWVAREVYGEGDPRWQEYRDRMLARAPREVVSLYLKHGEEYADHLKSHPAEKAMIRASMDKVLAA